MSVGHDFDERLRALFSSPPRGAATRDDCPDADRLSLIARGGGTREATRTVLDHVAACAACTVAWRFAREAGPVETRAAEPAGLRAVGAAAVVLVAIATGALLMMRPGSPPPGGADFRATGAAAIRATISDGATLPRSAFVLRWTPGPERTRYTVLVTDERLTPVAEGVNLDVAELKVAEAALAALPDGARVLWQVRADLPDGTRVATETFVALVGRAGPR